MLLVRLARTAQARYAPIRELFFNPYHPSVLYDTKNHFQYTFKSLPWEYGKVWTGLTPQQFQIPFNNSMSFMKRSFNAP